MDKSKVYFTNLRTTPSSNLLDKMERLVKRAGIANIDFKNQFTAIKIHFGEPGNLAYIRPNYAARMATLLRSLGAKPFLTDCNTLYSGRRSNAVDHLESAMENGFNPISAKCEVIIADGLKGTDYREIDINGEYCKAPKIGSAIADADIILTMNHFKGHEQTGFGGALKNISIGIASAHGKAHIHGVGVPEELWTADHNSFLECMADAAKSVVEYLGRRNMAFINVANRLSVDCDCDAHPHEPEMADIGVFASLDPVALDQACVDAVYASPDPGKAALIERMESRNGIHTVETACALGIGVREYELIYLD